MTVEKLRGFDQFWRRVVYRVGKTTRHTLVLILVLIGDSKAIQHLTSWPSADPGIKP